MKIAILGAMDEEIRLLQSSLTNMRSQEMGHLTLYLGELFGKHIVLVKCGIGKVASAVATAMLITECQPDYVINTGSAGGFDQHLNIGDVVIGEAAIHNDVDLTHFGYQIGQCAGMPEVYHCDRTLLQVAKQAAGHIQQFQYKTGLICSGDSFIGSDDAADELKQRFPRAIATEMESAAIGQACYLLNTPFIVIRSLSDIAGKTSSVSFNEYLEQAAKHSAELVMGICKAL